jgi:hypothetical protein
MTIVGRGPVEGAVGAMTIIGRSPVEGAVGADRGVGGPRVDRARSVDARERVIIAAANPDQTRHQETFHPRKIVETVHGHA